MSHILNRRLSIWSISITLGVLVLLQACAAEQPGQPVQFVTVEAAAAAVERGVNVVAVSTDSEDKATQSKQDWGLDKLTLGYGLSIETAREWGLFISTGIKQEPAEFSEPGLFLIRPGGEVYFVSVQSMPFARPPLDDVLSALDFVLKNDYPARGELAA
mgnify:CR=1 FL=1